jgi:uncharacterized protein GlcG (DUF336 family)
MIQRYTLSITQAQAAVHDALEKASEEVERPVAVAVVDDRGDLVSFARMDNSAPICTTVAINKACTAALAMLDTDALAKRDRELGRELATYGDPRFTSIKGGLCVRQTMDDGRDVILGGIGVSGRTPDEDEQLAKVALEAMNLSTK